jgi:hypothetical protein
MRFVSKYGRHTVQCRAEIMEAFATGQVRILQKGILCHFEPYKCTPEEREFALNSFSFQGWYQEADEATMVPLDYRIGLYDTNEGARDGNWDEATKTYVEEFLVALQYYGDIAKCPEIVMTPPWPKYDTYRGQPAQLIRKLVDEGHDLNYVLAYESSDGPQRQSVIDALVDALSNDSMLGKEEEVLA